MLTQTQEQDKRRNFSKDLFYLETSEIEKLLGGAINIEGNPPGIPTNRLEENALTNPLFGEIAQEYGLFLNDLGIDKIYFYGPEGNNETFITQAYFGGIRKTLGRMGSSVGGDANPTFADVIIRGIKK